MDKIELVNKIVNVKNVSILGFMYPNYVMKEDIFFDYENDIIFVGKPQKDVRGMLQRGTRNFISTVGMYDVDFDNRDIQIRVLYSKWNKEPNEKVQEILSNMSEEDFWDYFKKYWVIGSSKIDKDDGVNIFDLYKVLGKSRHDILNVYLKLRETYEDGYILSCVLSFIEKSYNMDSVTSTSGRYLQMLKDFNRSMGASMKPIMYALYTMDEDKSYKTIWLLSKLGKGEMI